MTPVVEITAGRRPSAVRRIGRAWPRLVTLAGFLLYAVVCLGEDRLPVVVLLAGPAVMLAGIVFTKRR